MDAPVRRLFERIAPALTGGTPDVASVAAALIDFARDHDYLMPRIRTLGERRGGTGIHAPERGTRLMLVHRGEGQMGAIHDHGCWVALAPVTGRRDPSTLPDRASGTELARLELATELAVRAGEAVTMLAPEDTHSHGHVAGSGEPGVCPDHARRRPAVLSPHGVGHGHRPATGPGDRRRRPLARLGAVPGRLSRTGRTARRHRWADDAAGFLAAVGGPGRRWSAACSATAAAPRRPSMAWTGAGWRARPARIRWQASRPATCSGADRRARGRHRAGRPGPGGRRHHGHHPGARHEGHPGAVRGHPPRGRADRRGAAVRDPDEHRRGRPDVDDDRELGRGPRSRHR